MVVAASGTYKMKTPVNNNRAFKHFPYDRYATGVCF